ncbi:MAG: heme exporter protein D [Arenicella sp.]|jgi:heme exporter protein D
MYFEDISSFFDMGGYAIYVWLSFGSAALSLLVLWVDAFFSKRTLLTQVLREQTRQARINAAAEQSATAEKSATAEQSATATQRTNGETI